jgi:hypothetical protein
VVEKRNDANQTKPVARSMLMMSLRLELLAGGYRRERSLASGVTQSHDPFVGE